MTAKRTAIILVLVLAIYLVIAGWQGIAFISTGSPLAIGLGIGVLLLPVVGIWVVWRELQFGFQVQAMARTLEAEGGLPVDDVARTGSGRLDRDAADQAFANEQVAVEQSPDDWRAWFRVAAAYDAAGDRKRARAAMRHALTLYPK